MSSIETHSRAGLSRSSRPAIPGLCLHDEWPAARSTLSATFIQCHCRIRPVSLGLGCFHGCLLAVNHPRDTESINEHTKSRSPECLPERHRHRTVFHQGVKYSLCLCRVFNAKVDIEAVRFLVVIWRCFHPHQHLAAD